MFEFGEYCFIKWKFKFWNFLSEIRTKGFSIDRNFCSIDQNDEENNLGVSGWFDRYSILVRSIEKSIRSIERNSQPIETGKTEFSAEFFGNCLECLKRLQVLWMVLRNILTLHTCLFFFPSMLCYCCMAMLVKLVEGYVIIICFFIFNVWSLVCTYLFNFWAFMTFFFVALFVLIINKLALKDSWRDLTKFRLVDLLLLRFFVGICIHIKLF